MMKLLGKYVLAPGAGVAMLAGFGIFDLGPGAGGSGAGLTTVDEAGGRILSALEGPLAVAQRIATAGAGMMDIDPGRLPAFMTGGSGGAAGAPGGDAGAPTAARKTVSVAGEPAAGVMPSGGAWKSSRPPATE